MPTPVIETERFILRPQIEADYEALCAIWADPEVVRYISGVPSTREQSWHRLVRGAGHVGDEGLWTFRHSGQGERPVSR